MCCDREAHPLHEASVEVEFTPQERRAFDFPPCCAKVLVTPALLEKICSTNESKSTGGALFPQSERWIRTMPRTRSANWQRMGGVGKYRGKGATCVGTADEAAAGSFQSSGEDTARAGADVGVVAGADGAELLRSGKRLADAGTQDAEGSAEKEA